MAAALHHHHQAQSSDKVIQDSTPTSESGAVHSCHAAGAVASTPSTAATPSTTQLLTTAGWHHPATSTVGQQWQQALAKPNHSLGFQLLVHHHQIARKFFGARTLEHHLTSLSVTAVVALNTIHLMMAQSHMAIAKISASSTTKSELLNSLSNKRDYSPNYTY